MYAIIISGVSEYRCHCLVCVCVGAAVSVGLHGFLIEYRSHGAVTPSCAKSTKQQKKKKVNKPGDTRAARIYASHASDPIYT